MMILELWRKRERPSIFSSRWFKVWAKRCFHTPALLQIILTRSMLKLAGASLGEFSLLKGIRINGPTRNLSVGQNTFIAPGVKITTHGEVHIGSFVCINEGVQILSASHDVHHPNWQTTVATIVIHDFAWIATSAILLPGVTVGRGAVVGAGAVVSVSVPDFGIAVGNPAKARPDGRIKTLNFNPVRFAAPFEAWLGPTGERLDQI